MARAKSLPRLAAARSRPLSMKIFSLPKLATQSPRERVFALLSDSRSPSNEIARIERELKKQLRHKAFLLS
jgi:hypothetical protein